MKIQEGQCGLCTHFGEEHPEHNDLVQIRQSREAPADYKEECGHPTHAQLNLLVTATSGCAAFEPARM